MKKNYVFSVHSFKTEKDFCSYVNNKQGECLSVLEFFTRKGEIIEQLLTISPFSDQYNLNNRVFKQQFYKIIENNLIPLHTGITMSVEEWYNILTSNKIDKGCSEFLYKEENNEASFTLAYSPFLHQCFFEIHLYDASHYSLDSLPVKKKFEKFADKRFLTNYENLASAFFHASLQK